MDPQNYTNEDAYAEYVADNMPDLSEISAAALALIKAINKLTSSNLVDYIDTVETVCDVVSEAITESINYNEDDRFPFYIRDSVDVQMSKERLKWIVAVQREATDAKLAKQSIDMAGMVQTILTGGKS